MFSTAFQNEFSRLRAYDAGPRQDPVARQQELEVRAALGRTLPTRRAREVSWAPMTRTFESSPQAASSRSPVLDVRPAGASHERLGIFGSRAGPASLSPFYPQLTKGATEEQCRLTLLTGEYHRKHAFARQRPTDTLALAAQEDEGRFTAETIEAPPLAPSDQTAHAVADFYLLTHKHLLPMCQSPPL